MSRKSMGKGKLVKRGWIVRTADPMGREVHRADPKALRLRVFVKKDHKVTQLMMARTAWGVEENTPVSPLVFMHWFKLKPLPDEAVETFSRTTLLRQDDVHSFKGAVGKFLVQISYPEIAGEWRRLAEHLHQMISTADELLSLIDPDMFCLPSAVVVPTSTAISAALQSSLTSEPALIDARRSLRELREVWLSEIEAINPWVSKRGQKGDPALRELARRIVSFAGNDLSLPSNESKDGKKVVRKTPLLRFMREALEFVALHGDRILERSSLPNDRKASARKSLKSLASKSDGALIDHLRAAKKER